jgi:putative nucleotidyltransferase with HDIG domain
MENTKKSAVIYTYFIILTGAALLIYYSINTTFHDIPGMLFMALLSITAESLALPLEKDKGISVGFAITLCSILTFGPVGAAWITTAGALFKILYVKDKGYIHLFNTPFYKTAFNASNYIISCLISGWVYMRAGGEILGLQATTIYEAFESLAKAVIPLILLTITFLTVNSGILSVLFKLMTKQYYLSQWLQSFKWTLPNLFAVAALGIIITITYHSLGILAVLLFFSPLLLARYTFKLYINMRNVYFETIQALIAAVEAKDKYTEGHSRRVEKYASLIAREMKLSPARQEILRYAALLHDIGKIGISEVILNKTSELTKSEFDQIKEHPTIGYRILEEVDFLKQAKEIILYHHERYDGSGYPNRINGGRIPLEASIMAVADAFDAMTSDRPYRKSLGSKKAVEELLKNSGTQFSPEVVNVFIKALQKNNMINDIAS